MCVHIYVYIDVIIQSLGCVWLCDRSTPSLPVLHYLLEFVQNHVHWVSDAVQPSHPLLSLSPPTFDLSQHQGLFQWINSSHKKVKALELQPQHQPALPMSIQCWSPLGLTGLISLQFKGLSRAFFNTIVWKHQFFGAQLSLWSNSHIHIWLIERPQLWLIQTLVSKVVSTS